MLNIPQSKALFNAAQISFNALNGIFSSCFWNCFQFWGIKSQQNSSTLSSELFMLSIQPYDVQANRKTVPSSTNISALNCPLQSNQRQCVERSFPKNYLRHTTFFFQRKNKTEKPQLKTSFWTIFSQTKGKIKPSYVSQVICDGNQNVFVLEKSRIRIVTTAKRFAFEWSFDGLCSPKWGFKSTLTKFTTIIKHPKHSLTKAMEYFRS